jgi:DnaJ-class molecular chaperone
MMRTCPRCFGSGKIYQPPGSTTTDGGTCQKCCGSGEIIDLEPMVNTKIEESLDRIEKRMIAIEERQKELINLVRRFATSQTPLGGQQHSFPLIG